jgi:hypothetical protein
VKESKNQLNDLLYSCQVFEGLKKNWNWRFFDSGNFQETGTRGSLISKISNLWNLRLLKKSNNYSMLVQEPN